jgi:hypothetical protein
MSTEFLFQRNNNNVRGFGGFNLEELKPCLVEVHMGKAQIIVGRVFVESQHAESQIFVRFMRAIIM